MASPASKSSKKQTTGRSAFHRGHLAEYIAAFFLMCKGYRILGRCVKTPFGEIDLLAAKGGSLIAVEVKLRPNAQQSHAAISPTQQQRLLQALQHMAARNHMGRGGGGATLRCDAILFNGLISWPKHISNAFRND